MAEVPPSEPVAKMPHRGIGRRVVHLRSDFLGMRPMQGDEIARRYNDAWYSTRCGVEASSMQSTSKNQDGLLHTICEACSAAPSASSDSDDPAQQRTLASDVADGLHDSPHP